jgi:DNA-binding response OmpR family regulator
MTNKSILLVEDDQYLLALYARKFSLCDYTVYSARDGLEALRSFAKYHPDLLIVDLNIPQLSGWEVLETLSKEVSPPLAIVLSNYDQVQAREIGKLSDIVKDYFVKINTTPDELVNRVKDLLNTKK